MRLLPLLLPLSLPLFSFASTEAESSNAAANADANAAPGTAGGGGLDPPGLAPLITRANVLLSAGQFSDAVRSYSDAIELSPKSYVLFFKRATAYLSLNRHAPALDDFDTVLELTSGGFDKAYLMKAKIYTKEARWGEAKDMVKLYSNKVKGDRQAGDILFSVSEGEVALKKATAAQKAKSWETCVEQSTKALQTATYSAPLRRMRADCALAMGDIEQAVGDFTRLTHLLAPSTALLQSISTLSYFLLPPSTQALQTIKQCLHYDPDSKPCKAFHKLIRSNDKQLKSLDAALESSDWRQVLQLVVTPNTGLADKFNKDMDAALDQLPKLQLESPLVLPASVVPKTMSPLRAKLLQAACKAYTKGGQIVRAEKWCDELLKMKDHENDEDALVAKGEIALKKEQWEDAVRYFDKAFESSGRSSQDVMGRLQKAQRLLKQSKAKDYYKVLGVSRDADIKTIKRAYRKTAKDAHPDKGGSEEKMAVVNEAYEVLNNPELRARFDNGDDPNDPQSQGGPSGGNPFQGHPFGGFQGFQGFQGGQFGGGSQQFQFQWGG